MRDLDHQIFKRLKELEEKTEKMQTVIDSLCEIQVLSVNTKPGFYWVQREPKDKLEVAYLNAHQMGITLVDHDLRSVSEYHWIGERLEEPQVNE